MKDFLDKYDSEFPRYDMLRKQLESVILTLLESESIELFTIEGRVKTKNSIASKISRKAYINPLDEIEDLCGIRVICYYESDLDKIESIIRNEFLVISGSDKQREIDVDRFGYSSRHFIVKIKDEWLNFPTVRTLNGLKAEIQVRTMLMHTWAAISHKLLYKQENDAPREIKRNLSMLSALIELADEKFDQIKSEKIKYQEKILDYQGAIHNEEPLNSDNLIVLISKYSPNRKIIEERLPRILNEIKEYDSNVGDFEKRIKACMPYIENMEREEGLFQGGREPPIWTLEGFCRTVLDLTCDDYFSSRWSTPDHSYGDITEKYRNLIKNSQ
ncbi:hypothetical protein WCT79_17460 [Pectobacterium carotovorum]|uniref:GTP pyrophosphokinase n=1 Tax=Pectobacterium carotovorum TaxID=554 RepID=UPI003019921F